MAVIVYGGGNIGSQVLPQLEAIIASIPANPVSAKLRLRGHILYTGPSGGPCVFRIRQGSVTGTSIYQATIATIVANSAYFEVEDDSGWITQGNPNTNGLYVLTVQGTTGAGTITGGTFYLESVP
jgi:hypothetical protein